MKWHRLEATANSKPNIYGTKHLSLLTGRAVPEMMCSFNPGGGGYFRNFWVGMCRWDPGTLNVYQSYFS